LLVALSCLLVLLSTTEVWAHRTLLNIGALGVDPEQHFDTVPGALGDPRRGYPGA